MKHHIIIAALAVVSLVAGLDALQWRKIAYGWRDVSHKWEGDYFMMKTNCLHAQEACLEAQSIASMVIKLLQEKEGAQ